MRLVASGLSRTERGTFHFSGTSLGNAFAGSEGNVLFTTALATSNVRLTTAVANDVARSINALALSGGSLTGTGPLTIKAGAISFAAAAGLGADSSAIILNATGAGLTYTGAGALTLARPLETRTGIARFETQGGDFTLAGVISGAGGIPFSSGAGRTVVLALAGKVSSDLLEIIRERPTVVAELLRAMRGLSAKRVSAISRPIRDGDW